MIRVLDSAGSTLVEWGRQQQQQQQQHVHGGHVVGHRKFEGKMLLVFCLDRSNKTFQNLLNGEIRKLF